MEKKNQHSNLNAHMDLAVKIVQKSNIVNERRHHGNNNTLTVYATATAHTHLRGLVYVKAIEREAPQRRLHIIIIVFHSVFV